MQVQTRKQTIFRFLNFVYNIEYWPKVFARVCSNILEQLLTALKAKMKGENILFRFWSVALDTMRWSLSNWHIDANAQRHK